MAGSETHTDDVPQGIVRLSLSGGGLEFQRSVDEATAAKILGMVFGGGAITPQVTQQPVPQPPQESPDRHASVASSGNGHGGQPQLSPGEFVHQAEAKRYIDKIVTFGVYLERHRGQATFGRDDLLGMFQAAGEAAPKNFSRDLRWALSSKWMAPVPNEDGKYYVTTEGRKAVDRKFPQDMRDATPQPKTRRTRKKTAGQKGSENP